MKHLLLLTIILTCSSLTISAQTLREAIKSKDTVLAARLIKEGANPNELDAQGKTLLMEACHFPNIPIAVFLLRHGATADEPRSPKGRTALMVACAYWCGLDMVKILVDNGADVNAASQDGNTPLMLAASSEKLDVVNYLLLQGADAKKTNAAGKTALDLATAGKVEEYMRTSIKDTRFDREKVMELLAAAMSK